MRRQIVSMLLIAFIATASLILLQPDRWTAPVSADASPTANLSKPLSPLASSAALTVALSDEPGEFDPALDFDGYQITSQIYDTLFRYIGSDSNPVPGLIESWSASPDGKTWTFNLRPGLKFHDGTDLDAAAVAYNFNRWWDPAHPAHNGSFDYFAGLFGGYKGDPNSILVSINAIGSLQVQLILKSANNTLPSLLTNPALAMASPAAIQAGTLLTTPIGSGPFKFVEWVSGDHIRLTANLDYWDDRPQLDTLLFQVITDESARFAALQANSVQIVRDLARSDLPAANADPNLRVLWRPSSNTGYLGINLGHGPLGNQGARVAMAMALNKTALISTTYQTGDLVADQLVPPSIWGRDPNLSDYDYDPDQARQILSDAGYPNGFTTTLGYRNVWRSYLPNAVDTANAIAADLQAIGITATVVEYEASDFIDKWRDGSLDLFLLGWGADYLHPDNFFTPILCSDYLSFGPQDNELCSQLQAAQAMPDIADQLPIYH
ncbi:MAG TPA: ABC transporter substrate-binding protein, partial [Anaerolineae bacterium]